MTDGCLRQGCPNPRADADGSLGRFCSARCRMEYTTDAPAINTDALADAIVHPEDA